MTHPASIETLEDRRFLSVAWCDDPVAAAAAPATEQLRAQPHGGRQDGHHKLDSQRHDNPVKKDSVDDRRGGGASTLSDPGLTEDQMTQAIREIAQYNYSHFGPGVYRAMVYGQLVTIEVREQRPATPSPAPTTADPAPTAPATPSNSPSPAAPVSPQKPAAPQAPATPVAAPAETASGGVKVNSVSNPSAAAVAVGLTPPAQLGFYSAASPSGNSVLASGISGTSPQPAFAGAGLTQKLMSWMGDGKVVQSALWSAQRFAETADSPEGALAAAAQSLATPAASAASRMVDSARHQLYSIARIDPSALLNDAIAAMVDDSASVDAPAAESAISTMVRVNRAWFITGAVVAADAALAAYAYRRASQRRKLARFRLAQ